MHFDLNKFDLKFGHPKSNERESALVTIQAILARRGYSASRFVKVKGVSGKEHQFEILAKRTYDNKKSLVTFLVDQRQGSPFSLEQAMKLLVVSQDVGAGTLVLAVPNLSTEVLDFMNFHGMTAFEGSDWQSVISQLLLRFSNSME